MTQEELIDYCQTHYATEVTHPFKRYPDYVALRHQDGKWFALLMTIANAKLGLDGAGTTAIVNLKVEPELNSILQRQPGFLPGYHMNKALWLSVRLDQFTDVAAIADLIAASYQATR